MSKLKSLVLLLLVLLLVGLGAPGASGQDAGGGPPPNSGGGGGGAGAGGANPASPPQSRADRFRQMVSDHLKTALGASDDDWKVIEPRAQKVMTLQFQALMDSGMGRLMGRTRPGGDSGRPPTDVGMAVDALSTTLDDKTSSNNDIKVKVEALRAARAQSKKDIAAAQKDLRDVLTVRQEAILISYSILD